MDKERNKFLLFGQIVFVGFASLFIHSLIMMKVATLGFLYTYLICLLVWLPALCIGFIIFLLIIRSKYRKYITLKGSTIFCLILSFIIIIHAVSYYYLTVPPNEVTSQWHYDNNQDISKEIKWMGIHYDGQMNKVGYFYLRNSSILAEDGFEWEFDESTKIITMTEQNNRNWKLKLKLDISFTGSYYKMITYYVSDTNFTLFDPLLLDNTTWNDHSWLTGIQGREGIPNFETVLVLLVFFFLLSGFIVIKWKNKK